MEQLSIDLLPTKKLKHKFNISTTADSKTLTSGRKISIRERLKT